MDYLLKANAIVILFYLCYKLLLQKETFFESNRYFLLAGLATALIIPSIVIPIYIAAPELNEFNFITTENETPISNFTENSFNFFLLFQWIYLTGIVIFSIKFMIEFAGLLHILIQNKSIKKGNYTYVETKKDHSPFSFFKYIVYSPNHFSVTELEHIILHEKVHAKQYHSIDILITKITAILFWFNPFIWLYNKSLQQNLEFIADSNTQQKITDTKSYQTLLLKTVLSPNQMALVNNFYNSLIKKRIIMLHKSKSKPLNLWKYALILPLLALFLMSFNTKEIYTTTVTPSKTSNVSSIVKTLEDIEAVIITKDFSKEDFENAKRQFYNLDVDLKFKGIKRNNKGEIIAIKASFKTPENNKGNYNVSGQKPIKAFKFYYNSSSGEVGFAKVENHSFIVKGSPNDNVFILSGDDDHNDEKHTSYTYKKKKNNNNKDEDVEVIVKGNPSKSIIKFNTDISPNNYKLKKNTNSVYVYTSKDNNENVKVIFKEKNKSGKVKEGATFVYSNENNDNNNEDIIIVKKENVVNGTKVINTWKQDKNKEDENIIIDLNQDDNKVIFNTGKNLKDPIYIKDGKEITKEELSSIIPKTIKSVNILKGESAIKLHGEKAKNGVIIIKTK